MRDIDIKLAELKAEYDRLTEKLYAPDTSDAYARILRQMRRDIRDEIQQLYARGDSA